MKIVSIILTTILFFILVRLLNEATTLYRGYASLKVFGVSIERVNGWEKPYIILSIIYLAIVALSLFSMLKVDISQMLLFLV